MNYRIFILTIGIVLAPMMLRAQLILPEFETSHYVESISDEADESNLFPYLGGNGLLFYRTYVKERGEEVEILRQNTWNTKRDKDKWAKPDRLFRMGYYPGENVIIGSSKDGKRVYLLNTIFLVEEDAFQSQLKYVEMNDKGRWSELKDIKIPGFDIGDRYAHIHLNQTEDILLVSISENAESENEDLFVSFKSAEGKWSKLQDLGPTINSKNSELTPFLAEDKRTLFFSSEGHGSKGGTDIFASYRLDDSWTLWTNPQNLGDSVNSQFYDENFVLLSDDQYYFTSTRRSELADIYTTSGAGRFEINKVKGLAMMADQGLSLKLAVKEDVVYEHITTEADGSFSFMVKSKLKKVNFEAEEYSGGAPIFIYKLNDDQEKVARQVLDKHGKDWAGREQTIVARVNCSQKVTEGNELKVKDINGFLLGSYQADANGIVQIKTDSVDRILNYETAAGSCQLNDIRLLENGDLIALLANEQGRIDKDKFKADLAAASSTGEASSFEMSNEDQMKVYFAFNATGLTADERDRLYQYASELKKDPNVKISLVGFTDNRGSEEINLEVGRDRANMVKQILIDAGIDESRIQSESLGEKQPVASNQNQAGRAKNRRVEIFFSR